jgi:uncharacterized protein YukE
MSGPADDLDDAGDDAGQIRTAAMSPQCYTQDTLGGAAVSEAFDAFAAAWDADVSTLQSALHELAGKIRLSKKAYAGSDHHVAARTSAVTVGGNGLNGADDASVTLSPTGRPSALSGY